MEISLKKQRKGNNVANLPKILQNPANFQLLKNRGKENYRLVLFDLINSHLSIKRNNGTLKLYYLYPTRIPPQKHLHTILEECLNRVLAVQAADLKEKLKELSQNLERNENVIAAIETLLKKTKQTAVDYEKEN